MSISKVLRKVKNKESDSCHGRLILKTSEKSHDITHIPRSSLISDRSFPVDAERRDQTPSVHLLPQTHQKATVACPGSGDAARPNSEVLQVSQLNIITAACCVSSSLSPSHIMPLFPLFRKASFMCRAVRF